MEELLLKTKIIPPRVPDYTVNRNRLIHMLQSHIEKKLILICANAGYGKTTLLTQFIKKLHTPYLWYHIDTSDQDINFFIQYIIEGLKRHIPQFGKRTRALIRNASQQEIKLEILFGTLINELVELSRKKILLIFDDLHEIYRIPKIISGFEYLLNNLPTNVSIVASTRSALPFSLDRFQIKNEVWEIDQEDLKFTKDEITLLCEHFGGYTPKSLELHKLRVDSEGWITCLQFLIQPATSKTTFIKGKESLLNRLYAYFDKEIYALLDDGMKYFITATSVLDYLSSDACDFLLSRHDSKHILEELQKKHLFMSTFDIPKTQYAYHHLFRNFLTNKLRQANLYRQFQNQAGLYAEKKGVLSQALNHYLEAKNFHALARLIEEYEDKDMSISKFDLFRRHIEHIPTSIINKSPRLLRLTGWICFNRGDHKGLQSYYAKSKRCARQNKNYYEFFRTIHSQLGIKLLRGEYKQVNRRIKTILRSRHLRSRKLQVRFLNILGLAYWSEGRITDAIEVLKKTLKVGKRLDGGRYTNTVLHNLAAAYIDIGDFLDAQHCLEDLVSRLRSNPSSVMILALNNLGYTLMLQGNLTKAGELFEEGIKLAHLYNDKTMLCNCYLFLAQNRILSEELAQAMELLNKALHLASELNNNILLSDCWTELAKLNLARGDLYQAKKYVDKAVTSPIPTLHRIGHMITKVEIELSLKKIRTAADILNKARSKFKKSKYKTMIFFLQKARLYLLKKDEKKARSFINESLKLAEKYSYDFLLTHTLKRNREIIQFIKKAKFKSSYLQHIILQLPYSDTIPSSIEPDLKEYDFIFKLFGKTHIFIHGKEIKTNRLRTKRFQEIFAFFITNPKQTMTREKIIYTFWPDHNPSTSKQLFYNALYWIRKAVDKKIIVYNSLGYALSSQHRYWIDTEEFVKLTKAGDQLVQDGNLGAGLIKYEEAISLYRDGFMEDFYGNWCQEQRKYYEGVYLDVLRKLSYGHYKIGNLQKTVHFCNCIIRKDSYDEAAYCLAMRCYAGLNDVRPLQNCYATLEKTLARELKTTPSVETTKLFETLVKRKTQRKALRS
ncbi:hypothetical protein AMJ52_01890 [candidate division TA06 bacterium DG_78]|uniref:Uncharacterized protein n=1 Tax=candidate division TA06 bacterium DG_78 TaxID=1703772 RepID=A0A0S7YHW8_UNCT6|nr:MAG: hypothetical protein AMJ52_01890 [candidate division TA06 bacterium DG_78]